jgi:hypothetical protein
MPTAASRLDSSGSWNFNPVAAAMNARNWDAAGAELEGAAHRAPKAADRSFASSSLELLSQDGQPLSGSGLPLVDLSDGVEIQAAGRWQYFGDQHLAVYSGGVVARMAGLRSEGQGLQLNLATGKASFSPGTHFVRLADDEPAKIVDASGASVQDNDFHAARGADYLIHDGVLKLQ